MNKQPDLVWRGGALGFVVCSMTLLSGAIMLREFTGRPWGRIKRCHLDAGPNGGCA